MEEDKVLSLFDFYWFDRQILTEQLPFLSRADTLQVSGASSEEKQFVPLQSIRRSMSDQLSSFSPSSVLDGPKLETILSGKEAMAETAEVKRKEKMKSERRKSMRQIKRSTRSLSDLEFQELKGFMDLGFCFSEGEINPRLVSILPGLQRLAHKDGETEESLDEAPISRPYLSEAWGVTRADYKPVASWKINVTEDKNAMKDRLKRWAHDVASSVK